MPGASPRTQPSQLAADASSPTTTCSNDRKALLAEVVTKIKEASERRYRVLKECEAEAHKWKAEGDMYGWNYHMGRAGGCNESDIIYYRVQRWAEEELKKIPDTSSAIARADSGPLKLDTDTQVFFYEQDHYYLSNFSAFPLRWEGKLFATSEHAYHWEKFRGRPDLQVVLERPDVSAHDAFKLAERHKASRLLDWDAVKVNVMKAILRAKADQHEYVRRKLLETGKRVLIENSWRDPYWGWGPNRDGINRLGKLWMEVRADLHAVDIRQ